MKTGQGKMMYQDGSSYYGGFKYNYKDGEGTLVKANGHKEKQTWVYKDVNKDGVWSGQSKLKKK